MRALLAAIALLAMVGSASAGCEILDAYAPAGFVNVRRTPGLDGDVLFQLKSPAHFVWCGRTTRGTDGNNWSWVGFTADGNPRPYYGWVSDTILHYRTY